jgi:hypothetical protein
VTGGGTGSTILVTGGGTGTEAIAITLPAGTGMSMEVSLGCGAATVAIIDSNFTPIVEFSNVAVIGDTGLCGGAGIGDGRVGNPGAGYRTDF